MGIKLSVIGISLHMVYPIRFTMNNDHSISLITECYSYPRVGALILMITIYLYVRSWPYPVGSATGVE